MRTIITLKPTTDGKTSVTRETLFKRFSDRGGKRVRDAMPLTPSNRETVKKIIDAYDKSEIKRTVAFAALQKLGYSTAEAREYLGDTGPYVLGRDADDAKDLFIGTRGFALEPEDNMIDHAYTGDRRRVVIHNHLPVRKAKDATEEWLVTQLKPGQKVFSQSSWYTLESKRETSSGVVLKMTDGTEMTLGKYTSLRVEV